MKGEIGIAVLVLIALIVAGVWDIVAIYRDGPTISGVLQTWSNLYPVLPFLAGMLAGHIFWPRGK